MCNSKLDNLSRWLEKKRKSSFSKRRPHLRSPWLEERSEYPLHRGEMQTYVDNKYQILLDGQIRDYWEVRQFLDQRVERVEKKPDKFDSLYRLSAWQFDYHLRQ
jgi:hypothetical protein